ncbi:MAG: type I phosphomannose isomerase catalytic subunit [Gemmataceae bacterium]
MLPLLPFDPIFRSALWGGRRLTSMFPAAPDGPVSEVWVLSDQGDAISRVADGPCHGQALRDVVRTHGAELFGESASRHDQFPLLLKFIDAQQSLSVQVHPDDRHARSLGLPRGKTEAWVVLDSEPGSQIYAGLRPGITRSDFEELLRGGRSSEGLHSFGPRIGDCVFLPAGTVHALGAGIVAFEVQQTSDTTFRLDDWGRVDAKTGKPRELHVAEGLACTDFDAGPRRPTWPKLVTATPVRVEMLAESRYFQLRRYSGDRPFAIAPQDGCYALVGLDGKVEIARGGERYILSPGRTILCPASSDAVECRPEGEFVFLECTPMSHSDAS